MTPRPPRSTLFPYTTLFRSQLTQRATRALQQAMAEDEIRLQLGTSQIEMAILETQLFGRKRSEEHTSELQSQFHLVCRLLLEKKKHAISFLTRPTDTHCTAT